MSVEIVVRRDGGNRRTWAKAGAPPREFPVLAMVPRRWSFKGCWPGWAATDDYPRITNI
jgi:hypothetical protein